MKKIHFFIFSLLLSGNLDAQTWNGSVSTDWANSNNWTPASAPGSSSVVIIPGGLGNNYPKLSADVTIRSINMQPGSQLDFNGFVFNLNNVGTNPVIKGVTLKNSEPNSDIVMNLNTGIGGYYFDFNSSIINDNIIINISGTNTFYEGNNSSNANKFNFDAIFNINDNGAVYIGNGLLAYFNGNLSINRTIAGSTYLFKGGYSEVNGDFSYINNVGGDTSIGSGHNQFYAKVNISAIYLMPALFKMNNVYAVSNATKQIMVKDSKGFEFSNNHINKLSLNISGYRGNENALLVNNNIQTFEGSDFIISSDASYSEGNSTIIRNNYILNNGKIIFTNNGANNFDEADIPNSENYFIGSQVIFNANSTGALNLSKGSSSTYFNPSIYRPFEGITNAFGAGSSISGSLTYVNNVGGDTFFGNSSKKIMFPGGINITANYLVPAVFKMYSIVSTGTTGDIIVKNSKGFDIRNCDFYFNSLIVTGYRGDEDGTLYNNIIRGNVTIADDQSYGGGFTTEIRNNEITGNTSFTNNGTNVFNDANGPSYANKYIGNVSYTKNGADINIAKSTAFNEFGGDLIINSASGVNLGNLKFNGYPNNLVEQLGIQPIIIEKLAIEKPDRDCKLTLQDPIVVNQRLTLIRGKIESSEINSLTIVDDAIVDGGSENSFVDGPFVKLGNDMFTFPIGDDRNFAPISISASATNSSFTAEYKHNSPTIDGYDISQKSQTLDHILDQEYWLLDGNSPVFVTLSWKQSNSGQVNPVASSRVAHWNNLTNTWEDKGNSVTTGNIFAGTVKSGELISNFSPFAIASIDPIQPLPLNLISYTGKKVLYGNELTWRTANVKVFSHFEIERSIDAKKFEKIGEQPLDESGIYEFLDSTPPPGAENLFYRLRMIDQDGTYSFSKIIFIENIENEDLTIYPNPVSDYFSIKNNNFEQIQIVDISGKILRNFTKNSFNKYSLNGLATGSYLVKIKVGNQLINRKIMIE